MEASAVWVNEERFLGEATSGHEVKMDAGDKTFGSSPLELVLMGLCGCTASDVVTILKKKREPFTRLEVRATAERAAEPPKVFTEIRLTYVVAGKVSKKGMEDAVRLSKEKYCSVSAMLSRTARVTAEIKYED